MASVLLGTPGGELSGQRLVRTAELFGFAEGTTRVALSRMVAAGELTAGGGRYRLAGGLLARRAHQEQGRRPALRAWDGRWRMAVVSGAARPAGERAELRRSLTQAGLAEWREGVWVRPDNLAPAPDPSGGACTWLSASFEHGGAGAALARELWDLPGWRRRAERLLARMEASAPALAGERVEELAPSFALAAAVVRHLAADPLLPAELLPPRWPGPDLRAAYDAYEAAWQRLLRGWLRGLPT